MLVLKRNPTAFKRKATTSFLKVGMSAAFTRLIYKANAYAPREAPWFWGLEFHEWQGSDGRQYGNVASLEAAKQAFCVAWDRRPKASGKS
jgi:hypothetical protein